MPVPDPALESAVEPHAAPETHVVRLARGADLRHLADLEASGADQFVAFLGPELNPVLLSAPSSGARRDDQPGFLLVAALGRGAVPWERGGQSRPIGFAHVVELDGNAHLEQVSVRPEAQRRGIGSDLVRAAMAEARALGHPTLSLCTYRDVPWNGPFYAGLGFTEVTDLAPYQQRLRDRERQMGLDDDGVRVVMQAPLRRRAVRGCIGCPP